MTTIGITGGRGMLGSDINEKAEAAGYKVNIYDLPECDLRDEKNIEQIVGSNDIIINCAAYTAVDKAESEKDICSEINAEVPGKIGKLAAEQGKYVIHISTDFVFGDSSSEPLTEESLTNPLSIYGATKLEGEKKLAESGCRNAVIRVQWTYGKNGNHFVSKIIELAEKMPELKVVADQYGSPTPTSAAADAVLCFVRKQIEGLFHFAAEGYTNRFETAKFILNELNIDIPLSPCDSSCFPAPAKRPLNSRFDCSKIDKVLDFRRPEWKEAMKKFIAGNYSGQQR
jgi:dTDP-4-dehydrorhamnose reductase